MVEKRWPRVIAIIMGCVAGFLLFWKPPMLAGNIIIYGIHIHHWLWSGAGVIIISLVVRFNRRARKIPFLWVLLGFLLGIMLEGLILDLFIKE